MTVLAAVLLVGLYHQTARRVLAALFRTPHLAVSGMRERMAARAVALRQMVTTERAAHGGGTLFGAALVTGCFLLLFAGEVEMNAVTWGPLLGLDLSSLEHLLHLDVGTIETLAVPAIFLATVTTTFLAAWLLFELATPRLLATQGIARTIRIKYGVVIVVSVALALALGVNLQSGIYRSGVSADASSMLPPTSTTSDDAVAAVMAPPPAATSPSGPARSAELTMYRWIFIGIGLSTFLMLWPSAHFGPLALASELRWLLLTLLAVAAVVASACASVAHGLLGWTYEVIHPAIEIAQKVVITLMRPLIAPTRQLHARERTRPDGARPWMLALTAWSLDVEMRDEAAGEGSLHEGVAPEPAATSSEQEPTNEGVAMPAAAAFEEPPLVRPHAWEAYPSRDVAANATPDEGHVR